jgi:hypothetical protein
MAIRLKVQETKVKLKVNDGESITLHASEGVPIYPTPYTGVTEIVPTSETQIIPTNGMMMVEDIIVDPIPSNYGLITWNGSTLTVS